MASKKGTKPKPAEKDPGQDEPKEVQAPSYLCQ